MSGYRISYDITHKCPIGIVLVCCTKLGENISLLRTSAALVFPIKIAMSALTMDGQIGCVLHLPHSNLSRKLKLRNMAQFCYEYQHTVEYDERDLGN